MTIQQSDLFHKIEEFYEKLHKGEYDYPLDLAKAQQTLADLCWDQVEELYQSSICILH